MSFLLDNKYLQQILLLLICIVLGVVASYQPLALASFVVVALCILITSASPITVLAFMLILAPLRTLIATESAIQLPLDIGQITFVGAILTWFFHRAIQHQKPLKFPDSPILLAVGAFTIAVGLTAFSALSIQFWITEWLKWVTVIIMIILTLDLGHARRWEMIVGVLVASGLANAIVGLYIFFGGSGADHLLINNRFFRAFGTFGQPNPFGGFLGILLPIALMASYAYLMQIWNHWRLNQKIETVTFLKLSYFSLASAVMLAGIIASWSRGAWLGFVVSVAVMAFCLPRKIWQSIGLLGITISLVGILWFAGVIPASIQQRVLSSTEELFSFSDVRGVDVTHVNYAIVERLAHWQAAINMAENNPWLGVGLGNYEVAYNQYRLINWEFPLGHAHNYYLNILGEAGIIGFLFYVLMWLTIVIITWKNRSHPDLLARSINIGIMGSWAYFSFHSLLDNLYVNNLFLHFGVILGLVALFQNQLRKSIQWGTYVSSK
ncbi:MAG: O-antigen ligase family protein [Phototrophicaceae bacterium]